MGYASTDYMKYVFCANRKNCATKNSCPYRSRSISISGERYVHYNCAHGRFPTVVFSAFIFMLSAALCLGFVGQKKIADVSAEIKPPVLTDEHIKLLSSHDAVAGGVAMKAEKMVTESFSGNQVSSLAAMKKPAVEKPAVEKPADEKESMESAAEKSLADDTPNEESVAVEKGYREVTLEVTGYTLSFESCGKFPDDPDYGITASGTYVKPHHTISAPKSMSFGTNLRIPAYEKFWGLPETRLTVEDRGGAIKEGKLDIYFENEADAFEWGRRKVTVYIYD